MVKARPAISTLAPGFRESQPRIYVKFRAAGSDSSFLALVDTGAHYCILNTTAADVVGDQLGESFDLFVVETARGRLRGKLYRHTITLIAQEGESLDIDSIIFVPPDWEGPCFLGYAGTLEYARFAINPAANRFHFGGL
jgi:predicted aspartyl protease